MHCKRNLRRVKSTTTAPAETKRCTTSVVDDADNWRRAGCWVDLVQLDFGLFMTVYMEPEDSTCVCVRMSWGFEVGELAQLLNRALAFQDWLAATYSFPSHIFVAY